MKRIVLAGGCFWGVEAYYKQIKGVVDTNVGYTNGNKAKPSYEDLKTIWRPMRKRWKYIMMKKSFL